LRAAAAGVCCAPVSPLNRLEDRHMTRATLLPKIWIATGIAYLVIGMTVGILMAATGHYEFRSAHAHINLLGWVSMLLFGLLYDRYPRMAKTRLGLAHLVGYQAAALVIFVSLGWMLAGHPEIEPLLSAASILALISVLLFAVNFARYGRD
jgi:cbb3-type cytochrome oxidase subunit 1